MIQEINQLISLGDLTSALDLANRAIGGHADYYLYHEKKAGILLDLGDRKGAVAALRHAAKLRPDLDFLKQRIESLAPPSPQDTTSPVPEIPDRTLRKPFCGVYHRYPDKTGKRQAEGGIRLEGHLKDSSREHPLVSIVTVVFNNPVSLERCIRSVLDQDYPNVEYIIVDGGSDEPTLDLIRKHASRIDYFVSEPDGGIYPGMNKGIQLARGQYVCLLNSDDQYDTTFVSKTVSLAQRNQSELVFTDYIHGDKPVASRGINPGILFGHLNLNHGTFLVSRRCYDLVGPYPEDYRIVSDAVWMRGAFKKGVRFDHVPEPLLTFAADGLSSGGTSGNRELFVSEAIRSYRDEFGFLQTDEAEQLYLLRFNPKRLAGVLAIADKHARDDRFSEALANYLEHCFRDRENFRLPENAARELFPVFLKACRKLAIPESAIRMATKRGCFSEIISDIDRKLSLRKSGSLKTILHFATVFSAPSETFIYDLLVRLENHTSFDSFVLFDYAKLEDARPFAKGIRVPWADFHPETRNAIYQHILDSLKPDIIIGHFALNTWKLAQRIEPLNIRIPMLSMMHGIDVFRLQTPGPYRDFMLDHHVKRKDTRITAVSGFLRDRLVGLGVPREKIDLVHNTINPRFLANRKPGSGRARGAPVKLLSVGRLVDWKGHRHLLQALSRVRTRMGSDISLTIVYANGDGLLQEISDLIGRLDLESNVELIPFVDFEADAGFFGRFDLFVHPSTYSDDGLGSTETFGMSVLEAIATGLPVIVTDAGGVPEVVGEPNRFARIVPHGDSDSLADAIFDAIQDPSTFEDNREYADERLARFSERGQLVALAKSILRITGGIEASLFTTSTLMGAGYAAYRLHRGLLAGDVVNPTILTTIHHHGTEPGVRFIPHPTTRGERWATLQKASNSKPSLTMFTVNHPAVLNSRLAGWIETADVINLHWTARFLSVENVSYLTRCGKPVVLTLRDMFPITGGCHYFHGCDEWSRECANCPQLIDHWDNFPAKVLKAKRDNYDFRNLTLVALSRHSEAILRRAPLFRDCRIEVIPNSIETEVFRPRGQVAARERLGLPQDRRIIAYVPSFSSDVKGYREAAAALSRLEKTHPDLNPLILLVGRDTPATRDMPFDKHVLGFVRETEALSFAYSAADVVIVPSLEETFSNTTAEAISCGTPVVGFKTGAIPEMAIDDHTGYTFEVGDACGLADGIAKVLRQGGMGGNCRKFAEEHLRFDLQARRYENLFTELLALGRPPLPISHENLSGFFSETTTTIANLLRNIPTVPTPVTAEARFHRESGTKGKMPQESGRP